MNVYTAKTCSVSCADMGLRDELKAARLRQGMTQTTLAEGLGVSQVTLSRWETGAAPMPAIDTVQEWADLLGVRLHIHIDFVEHADPFEPLRQAMTPDEIRALVAAIVSVKKVQSE